FHHTFEDGIMVSKEALIRFHFLPFGCMYLQGKIALIHSYNEFYTEYFARTNCKSNLTAIGQNISTGILQSECKSPGTALFRFIDTATMDYKRKGGTKKKGSLTLYHFSNFGASPEVTVYSVPNQLFRFYHFTQGPEVKADWNSFIAGYYVNSEYKSAKYNEETNHIDFEKKGVVATIPESENLSSNSLMTYPPISANGSPVGSISHLLFIFFNSFMKIYFNQFFNFSSIPFKNTTQHIFQYFIIYFPLFF
ncbi:hypothetical protein EZS27_029976, partial [termite gut metagenome]